MGNSPKKVLFIITKGNFGGAQRYVYDLACSLPKDQFTPVVAFGASAQLKRRLASQNIETIEIESFQRDMNPILELKALKEVMGVIKKVKPDVIHVNSSKAGGIGAVAGRLCGVNNIIFTAHNWAWNEKRNIFSKGLIILGHWFTCLLSDNIICVSEETARQGRKLPFVSKKISVIHNGIGGIDFLDRERARLDIDPARKNTKIIGIVGELHENKGIDIAMKAFDLLEDTETRLFIIGTGEQKEKYISLKNTLKSKDRIIFVGFKETARIYLKAFDIFLLPSRNEAFPYVLLEAGKAGLPVIASRVGGVPELIIDDQTGKIVEEENVSQLANAMEELLKDSEKATFLGGALKDRVLGLFSLSLMAEKTIDLYNKI